MTRSKSLNQGGPLAAYMGAFISHKRALGYRYDEEERQMKQFENFCAEQEIIEARLTKELVEAWVKKRKGESPKTQQIRSTVIRQFALFLSNSGLEAYALPPQKNAVSQSYLPYIFTTNELAAIFRAADCMAPCPASPYVHKVMPMILRVLYGCGLRLSEACGLKKIDVSLDTGVLTILNAKNEKDRLVPMSISLTDMCIDYFEKIEVLCPNTEYFFPNRKGYRVHSATVYDWFRRFLSVSGIQHGGRGKGPRVHDFRHSFSVHSLRHMALKGLDLYCALPALSAYLGHENISATEKYLRMTAQVHPEILEQLQYAYGDVLPTVEMGVER